MKPSAWSVRLLPAAAAIAVTLAALATMADAWSDRRAASVEAARPAADAPVHVVRVPPREQARQHPAVCRDCVQPRVFGGNL